MRKRVSDTVIAATMATIVFIALLHLFIVYADIALEQRPASGSQMWRVTGDEISFLMSMTGVFMLPLGIFVITVLTSLIRPAITKQRLCRQSRRYRDKVRRERLAQRRQKCRMVVT